MFTLSQSNQASLVPCIDTLSTSPAIKNERFFTEIAVKEDEGLELFELWRSYVVVTTHMGNVNSSTALAGDSP